MLVPACPPPRRRAPTATRAPTRAAPARVRSGARQALVPTGPAGEGSWAFASPPPTRMTGPRDGREREAARHGAEYEPVIRRGRRSCADGRPARIRAERGAGRPL